MELKSIHTPKTSLRKLLVRKTQSWLSDLMRNMLDKDLKGINYEYEAHQTKYAKHQGILLIAKRDTTEKIFANDEPYFMTFKSKDSNSNFIIGAYFKENMKEIILNKIDTLIKRIRKTYINPNITMY